MARRLSSPAFIGRTTELESLLGAADAADGARASLLLLGGEAGVGKSRLIAEVVARLAVRLGLDRPPTLDEAQVRR